MSSTSDAESRPYVESAAAGVGAWVLGYLITYLLVATEIESSPLNDLIEFFEGDSATYELVGWVFYNAHLVDVTYTGIDLFSPPPSFIGGEDGFTALLYVVPPALLLIGGLAVGRYRGVTGTNEGAVAGALLAAGYVLPSAAGAFVFTVSVGSAAGSPDPLTAVVVAGLFYPLVFGAIGGVAASVTD